MPDSDISLTFDTKPFVNAMNTISSKLSQMTSGLTSGFSQLNNFAKDTVNTLTKRVFSLGLSFFSIKKAMSAIPEIGKTFELAGDVISRNLFAPLRQELIPILQSVLNWVRDNRAMFVKWGGYIANVFRAVMSILKGVWGVLKEVWKGFKQVFEAIFGTPVKQIGEMFNMLIFKAYAVFTFIIEIIKKVVRTVVSIVVEIAKGFFSAFGNIITYIQPVITAFENLAKAIGLGGANSSGLKTLFRIIGGVLGTTVAVTLHTIYTLLGGIVQIITSVIYGFRMLAAVFKRDWKEVKRLGVEGIQGWKSYAQNVGRGYVQIGTNMVNSARETAMSMRGNPQVTRQNISSINRRNNIRTTNNNINIHVNGSRSPVETGRAVVDELRNRRVLEGNQNRQSSR